MKRVDSVEEKMVDRSGREWTGGKKGDDTTHAKLSFQVPDPSKALIAP